MSGRGGLLRLVLVVLGVAAIAFWLGTLVGGDGEPEATRPTRSVAAPEDDTLRRARDPFSPNVSGDPDFVARQRENLAALDRQCDEGGDYCAEARALRGWLEREGHR